VQRPALRWSELQTWLLYGFEEWGPSWDLNSLESEPDGGYLLGQLAHGDEANSIAVIIPPGLAAKVREILHELPLFQATVTGYLYHWRHLPNLSQPSALGRSVGSRTDPFDYCIMLKEEHPQHTVDVLGSGKPELYSGYLWQCWGPAVEPGAMDSPRLDEVYFIWEHTDLSKRDALEYGQSMLQDKAAYFKARSKGAGVELELLQRSSTLAGGGSPRLPTEQFYAWLTGHASAPSPS
jgi:hypothetical protein